MTKHRYVITGLFVFIACLCALTLHGGRVHAATPDYESYCPPASDPGHTIHAVYADTATVTSTSPDVQINLIGQAHICSNAPYDTANNIIENLPSDTSATGSNAGIYDSSTSARLNYYHHEFDVGNLSGKGSTSAGLSYAITATNLQEDENCFTIYFTAQADYPDAANRDGPKTGSWFFCIYYHNPNNGTGCSGTTPFPAKSGTAGCCPQPNMTGFVDPSDGKYKCACPTGQHWVGDDTSGACQNDTNNNCTDTNADNYNQPGPCKYTCHDQNADNFNQPGTCTYTPKCNDPNANNYNQKGACTYKPVATIKGNCQWLSGTATDKDTPGTGVQVNIYESNTYIGYATSDSNGNWTLNIAARTNDAKTRTYSATPLDTQSGPDGTSVSVSVGPCNQPPTTSINGNCTYNDGWLWGNATDPDTPNTNVTVKISMGGSYIGSATGQGDQNGLWTFHTYPSYTNDAQIHNFSAYAVDTQGGPDGSTVSASVGPCNKPPTATIDGNCSYIWGYAGDPDTSGDSTRVDIYRNGSKIGNTFTDTGNRDGANRSYWVFQIDHYKSFTNDKFSAVPIDSSGGPDGVAVIKKVGPCEYPVDVTCSITTSPANVETGQPFTVTASLNYFPVPADGVPYRPAYTMAIQVGPGGSLYNNSDANYTTTTLSATFTTPSITTLNAGVYDLNMTFKGGNLDEKCHSTVAIGTYPYYRVYGGDVSNGGGVAPACSSGGNGDIITWNKNNSGSPPGYNSYGGAGTQLAAFALGHINGFATSTNNFAASGDPTKLAFANNTGNVNLGAGQYGGGFTGVRCIPDFYANHHTYNDNGGSVDLSLSGAHSWEVNGPVSIPGTLIKKGAKLSLYVNGDITIWNNGENYDTSGSYGTPDQIPSFYVVATGNIYIIGDANPNYNVSSLDGVYVSTGGTIYTCAKLNPGTPDLSGPFPTSPDQSELINNCTKPLTITGALIAKQIKFLRLRTDISGSLINSQPGDGPDPNKQAEIFQFTPEMWLTLPAPDAGGSNNAPTLDSITNLPPVL